VGGGVIPSDSSGTFKQKTGNPSYRDVLLFLKESPGISEQIARRFFLLNEYRGWKIQNRHGALTVIRNWRLALSSFAQKDSSRSKRDKIGNDEFWQWAQSEFDESEIPFVEDWVISSKKNKWQRKHGLTGELEPISDFRKSCRAFVDSCNAMGIPASS
jgi:hypothetical protein